MSDTTLGKTALSCADVRELIGNDLDRELTVEMRLRLQRHIRGCDTCRADAASLARSLDDIHSLGQPESAEPWFAERTLDRLLTEYESEVGDADGDGAAIGQLELWPNQTKLGQ
jgi:hypothetical protein